MSAENPRGKGSAESSTDADDKEFSCPSCDDVFDSSKAMKLHHVNLHGESIAGVEYSCDWCEETFRIDPYRKERSNYICCSRKCSDKIQSKHYSGKNHGSWKGNKVEVDCAYCGDSKKVPPHRVENQERFYCGFDCFSNHGAPWMQGDNHPDWKERVTISCEQCGDDIEVPPVEVDKTRFCSKQCDLDWRSEEFSGDGNPSWKGGYERYYGPSWTEQRKEARKRDGYTCQCCFKQESEAGREHHVHHIIPFRKFDDHLKANDLSNLVTLCGKCHYKWEGLCLRPDTR